MDLIFTSVPTWISVTFALIFSTAPIFLITNAIRAAERAGNLDTSSLRKRVIAFYWGYFLIVSLVSFTGYFVVNEIPPRIIVTTALPLFLFYLIYLPRTKWFQQVFFHVPLEDLVRIHLFRFVGVFFFIAYNYDVLPKNFAYIGGAGDILAATLVFSVLWALKKKASYAKTWVIIWNVIGLLDILSVLTTAVIITSKAVEEGTDGVAQFGIFPFSWIPAFAPATIIFLHILVFRKLKQQHC